MADDPEQPDFEQFEAEAREYAAAKGRERQGETRFASTRTARPAFERPDNPVKAHERHRQENAAAQERLLRSIADPGLREKIRGQVADQYTAWGRALNRAYNLRYDLSDRLYERKIAARKTDERLIPKDQKAEIRAEAVRESVAQSGNRIREINSAMPQMIDKRLGDAAKLPAARKTGLDKAQRAKDLASGYQARAAKAGRDRPGKDFER